MIVNKGNAKAAFDRGRAKGARPLNTKFQPYSHNHDYMEAFNDAFNKISAHLRTLNNVPATAALEIKVQKRGNNAIFITGKGTRKIEILPDLDTQRAKDIFPNNVIGRALCDLYEELGRLIEPEDLGNVLGQFPHLE